MKTSEIKRGAVDTRNLTTHKSGSSEKITSSGRKYKFTTHTEKEVNLLVGIAIVVVIIMSFLLRYFLDN